MSSEAARAIFNDPKIGVRYKGVERATGPFARSLIQQAGLPQAAKNASLVILDNVCGTGVVTAQLYEMLDEDRRAKMKVICGDFSEQMVRTVRHRELQAQDCQLAHEYQRYRSPRFKPKTGPQLSHEPSGFVPGARVQSPTFG